MEKSSGSSLVSQLLLRILGGSRQVLLRQLVLERGHQLYKTKDHRWYVGMVYNPKSEKCSISLRRCNNRVIVGYYVLVLHHIRII